MKRQIVLLTIITALALIACAARETRPVTQSTVPVTAGEAVQTEEAASLPEESVTRPLVIEERMVPNTEPSEKFVSSTPSMTSEEEPAKTIPFKVFYRGFTPIPLPAEDQETYTRFSKAGTQIIQSDDAWHTFMGEYCPGIPYDIDVDYTKECLIASVMGFARPTYSCARELLSIKAENGRLVFEYSEETDDRIYALNMNVSNFYVEIFVVNREDLPDGLL